MALLGGGFLRLWQTFLYGLAFCLSAIVLGLYSYFLSVLADRNLFISNKWKVVTGISGVAVVYTILAIVLTCCLGGIAVFGYVAVVFNILFMLGFIALAILTRDGASNCSGNVVTPLGNGPVEYGAGFNEDDGAGQEITYSVTLGTACRFNRVAFAVSIIAVIIFFLLAIFQVLLIRHSKKEKRYGPGPNNDYTAGSGKRRFWQRKNKHAARGVRAAEKGHHVDTRPSHDTAYTGSTVAPTPATGANHYGHENGTTPAHGHVPARNF